MSDTTKDNGGPAFPDSEGGLFYGMSLRDWFAGQAKLPSCIARALYEVCLQNGGQFPEAMKLLASHEAEYGLMKADAMLAERKKP